MKKQVLILSKVFPVSHTSAGAPTGFEEKFLKQKIHTIRSNYDFWESKKKGINEGRMVLSIRQWTGKPYCSPQKEICQIHNISLQKVAIVYTDQQSPWVLIDGWDVDIRKVARNDGLSVADFIEWFSMSNETHETGIFTGVCIQFTDFRY